MIYGNKFMNYGFSETTELTINYDIINLNNLIESFMDENDSILKEDAIDNLFEKMANKLKEILDNIILNVKKFINIAKAKMIALGNKIINKLDDTIAGKYEEKDSKELKDEVDEVFDDQNTNVSVLAASNESAVLNEAGSVVYRMYSPAGMLERFYDDLGTTTKEEQEFLLDYTTKFIEKVKDFSEYSEGGEKKKSAEEDMYEFATTYKEKYRNQIADGNIKIKDFIKELDEDFNSLKSLEDNKEKTKNELFTILVTENKDKESLKTVRDFIRTSLKTTENRIKDLAEYLNDEMVFQQKFKKVEDMYKQVNSKYWYIEFGNVKPTSLLKELVSEITALTGNQYKLYSKLMNVLIYCTKVNYGITLRCMNKWGTKPSSTPASTETKEESK